MSVHSRSQVWAATAGYQLSPDCIGLGWDRASWDRASWDLTSGWLFCWVQRVAFAGGKRVRKPIVADLREYVTG